MRLVADAQTNNEVEEGGAGVDGAPCLCSGECSRQLSDRCPATPHGTQKLENEVRSPVLAFIFRLALHRRVRWVTDDVLLALYPLQSLVKATISECRAPHCVLHLRIDMCTR